MKESFFVSIIIPCFNQGDYLQETLKSVLAQKHINWECLIVNDGSIDNTELISNEWCQRDNRFKYFYKENGGLSSARNFGILMAKGDWIQLLDSDDLLEKNKLYHQVAMIDKFNSQILISGYRYFIHSEGISSLRIMGRNNIIPEVNIQEEDNLDLIKLFQLKNPFVISAPLYKKTVFETVGLFDEKFNALEDWDFHLRCAEGGIRFQHTGYLDQNKTLIRIHNSSMMSSKQRMEEAYIYFAKKHKLLMDSNIEKNTNTLKRFIRLLLPPAIFSFYHYIRKNAN